MRDLGGGGGGGGGGGFSCSETQSQRVAGASVFWAPWERSDVPFSLSSSVFSCTDAFSAVHSHLHVAICLGYMSHFMKIAM